MKIEMGESLFYSWLRHVKECQIVQTNWKVSSQWELEHKEAIENFINKVELHFNNKYGYKIFKQNASTSQIMQQGECDAIGIAIQKDGTYFYAVDVAFHGAGLNYGTKDETVMKVIAKCVRTASVLYGYMHTKEAEIIFASPKINPAILREVLPCIEDLNCIFAEWGLDFTARLICNDEFHSVVLKPILLLSDGIADTSELFIRSYQMFMMFEDEQKTGHKKKESMYEKGQQEAKGEVASMDAYKELKIGQIARKIFASMLENGYASEEEIKYMQKLEYSKQFFHLNYPVLVLESEPYNAARYYAASINIRGVSYKLCNDWYEKAANNDRPYLIKWIEAHQDKKGV